mgnify:CR=1 FL=1
MHAYVVRMRRMDWPMLPSTDDLIRARPAGSSILPAASDERGHKRGSVHGLARAAVETFAVGLEW